MKVILDGTAWRDIARLNYRVWQFRREVGKALGFDIGAAMTRRRT